MLSDQVPAVGFYYDPGVEAIGAKVRGHRGRAARRPIPWGVWKAD